MTSRRDRGSASLELIALLPLLFLVGTFVLQGGAAMWGASSTAEAARQASRAYALGQDPLAAANASLPGGLKVTDITTSGPGHSVELTVAIPRVSLLPTLRVTRRAVMP